MKILLIISSLLISAQSLATNYDAYTEAGVLYMTVPADSCNSIGARLEVSPQCKADRLTKNYASTCYADVWISQTELACGDQSVVYRKVLMDLKENNVAPEANTLILKYWGKEFEVPVNW